MYSDISRVVITDRDKFNKFADETPSDTYKQYAGFESDKFQLHVLLKSEKKTNSHKFPANIYEQMSYLLAHVMVTMKTQSFHTHQNNYKYFFWSYIIHAIFKGYPTSYIHIFLGQYAPDHHLFIGKMSPILSSTKYFIVFAAIFELYSLVNYCAKLLDYVITGLIFKNPWDRCDNDNYKILFGSKCLPLDEFQKRINESHNLIELNAYGFIDRHGAFQLSQIAYFIMRKHYFTEEVSGIWVFLLYCLIIWFSSLALINRIYKKNIWKLLLGIQIFVYLFYLLVFINLISEQYSWRSQDYVDTKSQSVISQLMLVEYSLLTQSMSALPVMQMLSARSTQELRPGSTSSLFVICLSIFYLFRGLLLQELKMFASDITNTPLVALFVNEHWFYIWPLYFLIYKLGNLWTILFYITNFILEFTAMAISFNMITEVIFCEWQVRRLLSGVVIIVGGVLTFFLMTEALIGFLNFYSCVLPSLIEVIIIYLMYPYGRLIDDIKFKYSEGPSLVQKFSLIMLPLYVLFKTGIGIFFFTYAGMYEKNFMDYSFFGVLLLLFIAMTVNVVRHIFFEKKKFCRLFVPASDWGPTVHKTRELRKIYRSKEYIGSQAHRPLVRHMIKNAGSDYYKIDINYDVLSGLRSNISFSSNLDDDDQDKDDYVIDKYGYDDHQKQKSFADLTEKNDKPGTSKAITEPRQEKKAEELNNIKLKDKNDEKKNNNNEVYEHFNTENDKQAIKELLFNNNESDMTIKGFELENVKKHDDDTNVKEKNKSSNDKNKTE